MTLIGDDGLLDSSDKITAELLVERAQQILRTKFDSESVENAEAEDLWSVLHQTVLTPEIPFKIHRLCYESVYSANGDNAQGGHSHNQPRQLKPCWLPKKSSSSTATSITTNIERMMQLKNFTSYLELYQWSILSSDDFWMSSMDAVPIQWSTRPNGAFGPPEPPSHSNGDSRSSTVVDIDSNDSYYAPSYFPGGLLNIADSCLNVDVDLEHDAAIVYANESDPTLLQVWTNDDLRTLSFQVAHQIQHVLELPKGAAVAICMPMIPESIAIYLGIIVSGCVVVSIADSFSVTEIATRCRIANVQAAFTQDVVYRNDTAIPLADRIWQAEQKNRTSHSNNNGTGTDEIVEKESKTDVGESYGVHGCSGHLKVVVVPASLHIGRYDDKSKDTITLHESIHLRPGYDWNWSEFLLVEHASSTFDVSKAESVKCNSMDPCNILFSSGTTGEPKAVVWSHSTPIKCCIDGYYHQDITQNDVLAWPTNIGWMMGPWLLFQRMHGATICLFQGLPHTKHFCKFIEASNVTMLGVIPSLVKAWYDRGSIDGADWSRIRRFSSTGEASDEETYHWLMSRVPGKLYQDACSFMDSLPVHNVLHDANVPQQK